MALQNYDPKSLNTTVTTKRLLRVASLRSCQGNHIEMQQSATVARALCHIIMIESAGVALERKCKITLQFANLKLFSHFTLILLTYCTIAYYVTIWMFEAISKFHINFANKAHVRNNSTFLHFRILHYNSHV